MNTGLTLIKLIHVNETASVYRVFAYFTGSWYLYCVADRENNINAT
jgi:hypothetical protein